MNQIDRNNATPLYEQIKLILRDQIMHNEYVPGSLLPTEAELCHRFQVSRITVSQALNELERTGLIRKIRGKGSMVSMKPVSNPMKRITGFTEAMRDNGVRPGSRILSSEVIDGDLDLLSSFGLPTSLPRKFYKIRRLRYVNDIPAVIFTSFVSQELGSMMVERGFENASFYKLYEEILNRKIIRNETTLTAIIATREAVELLQVKPGSPQFHYRGLSYVEGDVPVELAIGVFRGDLFQFTSTIYRIREEVASKELESLSSIQVR
jgi:DNA-binding GntR family transcriptional regulator